MTQIMVQKGTKRNVSHLENHFQISSIMLKMYSTLCSFHLASHQISKKPSGSVTMVDKKTSPCLIPSYFSATMRL